MASRDKSIVEGIDTRSKILKISNVCSVIFEINKGRLRVSFTLKLRVSMNITKTDGGRMENMDSKGGDTNPTDSSYPGRP